MIYDNMYIPELLGLEEPSEIERHRRAATKLAQFTRSTSEDKIDLIVHILTFNIILYSTDFIDLDDPKSVQDIQACYACLLWRYVLYGIVHVRVYYRY